MIAFMHRMRGRGTSQLEGVGLAALKAGLGSGIAPFVLPPSVRYWFEISIAEREDAFDQRFGTDTSGVVPLHLLPSIAKTATEENSQYSSMPSELIRAAIGSLGLDFSSYVFLDIGCGKGRPVLVASCFPFKQVIGVEFSSELCDIARRNVARFRPPERVVDDVRIDRADATTYRLPDEPLLIYLNNPFGIGPMSSFLDNLRRSLEATPRPVSVVYQRPWLGAMLTNFVGLKEEAHLERPAVRNHVSYLGWKVYSTSAATVR